MAFKAPLRIAITTGDPDGIGLEVTAKALAALGPRANVQFAILRRADTPAFKASGFKRQTYRSLAEAAAAPFRAGTLLDIASEQSPAHWVQDAATECMRQTYQGLVTAPLSKTSITQAGFKEIGHTEILARVSGTQNLFMGFIGSKFAVVLAGGHEPLRRAVENFNPERLQRALGAAAELRSALPPRRRGRPMALVGLNPHAGEAGLIGTEERWMQKFITGDLHGPLVPDAAFLPKMWGRYSVYITPYHDQGLIPFKLVHGFSGGVHLTLGLPFVRTSVDHGTAKDLFGLNRAESGSMQDAIKTAIQLARQEPKK